MYAVIVTSGKQYKVTENDVLKVDKLEAEVGSVVQFDQVLAIGGAAGELRLGSPTIAGATISAEVLEQKRDDKIIVFKKERRHNYRRKNGHRQYITVLRILDVSGKGEKKVHPKKVTVKVAKPEVAVEKSAATEKKTAKKSTAKSTSPKTSEGKAKSKTKTASKK